MPCNHDDAAARVSRRGFIRSGALTATAVPMFAAGISPAIAETGNARADNLAFEAAPDFLATAKSAARWISNAEKKDADGIYWLPEPDHPATAATVSPGNALYSGNAGTILFFIELFGATGDPQYLEKVSLAADHLAATWRNITEKNDTLMSVLGYSLYGGVAGAAFSLNEAAKVTRNDKYRAAAKTITDFILQSAKPGGNSLPWSQAAGVIGDSGTLLYLLYAAREFSDARYLDTAVRAGDKILERAVKGPGSSLMWYGYPKSELLPKDPNFPGFEAGTAGIAYTLARLYVETKDAKYLTAAKQGAAYIESIATVRGNAALIPYQLPDMADIFYLGWCHGAAGSARTFYELYRVTGDARYKMWTERLARGILQSGAPGNRTPGYWNTVNQCCGNAGLIDFFLGLWASWGNDEYRDHARNMAENLVSRGTNWDGTGIRWDMAYTRLTPTLVTAETGFQIGASGIGSALVHMHLAEQGNYAAVPFPDSPFPRRSQRT
jgi:lantibiotic modifying enzyme